MPQSGFEEGFTTSASGSLDTWVKEIHAKVPGAVEGYIYDQLKLVIKDFFQRTGAWRTVVGPFTILGGDGTYKINPYDGVSNAIQVLSLYRNGTHYTPVPVTKIRETNTSGTTNPRTYYVNPYDTIVLTPTPTEDVEDLYADVLLTPRLLVNNRIPEWIVEQCYEAILAGTLHRLYQEPDKVYSSETKGEYWGQKYRSELNRSRTVAQHNYKASPMPWSFNYWNM
ncbi:MAG: hypothetical protein JRF07_05325 [Deltaproteobacteria bacterium]|jgi:hypothetical protein|nr:hypothetical protein [Deltaproteobacteria bacterium]